MKTSFIFSVEKKGGCVKKISSDTHVRKRTTLRESAQGGRICLLALRAFLRARHPETLRVFNKHGHTDRVVTETAFPIEYLIKPAELSERSAHFQQKKHE